MKQFHVADLSASGEIRATQIYDYATLEQIPGCSDLIARCSNAIYRSPEESDIELGSSSDRVSIRWRASASTTGIATVRCEDQTASISVLATGLEVNADQITLAAFQRHLTHELHDTGFEPAFDMLGLSERPLLATLTLRSPGDPTSQMLVAIADRCFAAAYFRYHGLA